MTYPEPTCRNQRTMQCKIANLKMVLPLYVSSFLTVSAQTPQFKNGYPNSSDTMPLGTRMIVVASMYSGLNKYFAHWQQLGSINTDSLLKDYMPRFIEKPGRLEFAKTMKKFLNHFHNGHTWYRDHYLERRKDL